MSATAVVHLVWRPLGMEPFEAFLASYERHEAGHEHDLVLLFNGFDAADQVEPYRRRARGLGAHELHIGAPSLDIDAYGVAARRLPHDRLCFLNSWTTLTTPGWLGLLSHALDDPGAGVVGASGAWVGVRSLMLWSLRLPSAYRRVLEDRRGVRVEPPPDRPGEPGSVWGERLKLVRDAPGKILTHPGFPAPHLRTNGFLIERELWLSLHTGKLKTEMDTHRFECGRHGMTVQLAGRGLNALIVGRDGRSWTAEQWPDADLFWQGTQRDLLMADNQTRTYAQATPAGRDLLSRLSWGERARPG